MPTVNLDTSARLDIICRRGDTFDLTVDFNEDITPYVTDTAWKLQVRDSDIASTALITVSGSSSNAATTGFEIDSTGEKLTIRITSGDMDEASGLYVYDLQTTLSSAVRTWLHGEFKITEDITI